MIEYEGEPDRAEAMKAPGSLERLEKELAALADVRSRLFVVLAAVLADEEPHDSADKAADPSKFDGLIRKLWEERHALERLLQRIVL